MLKFLVFFLAGILVPLALVQSVSAETQVKITPKRTPISCFDGEPHRMVNSLLDRKVVDLGDSIKVSFVALVTNCEFNKDSRVMEEKIRTPAFNRCHMRVDPATPFMAQLIGYRSEASGAVGYACAVDLVFSKSELSRRSSYDFTYFQNSRSIWYPWLIKIKTVDGGKSYQADLTRK